MKFNAFVIFNSFIFILHFDSFVFLALVLFVFSGTESERSCSYSTSASARESQRKLLRQSVTGNSAKPMKIAAINGKPKVNHRYLGMSRECEFLFYSI